MLYKNHIFQCMGKIFFWNFKGTLWNSTQNILPIHWKMWILFTTVNLRALIFKSSKVFLKRPPGHFHTACWWPGSLLCQVIFCTARSSAAVVNWQWDNECPAIWGKLTGPYLLWGRIYVIIFYVSSKHCSMLKANSLYPVTRKFLTGNRAQDIVGVDDGLFCDGIDHDQTINWNSGDK